MTSFNHYALGAVADWLHRTVGGIAPAEPGYRCLEIQLRLGGGLTHARTRHRTPYGMAESAWKIAGGQITIEVMVPPNTTARVTLPGNDSVPIEVGAGTYHWSYPYQALDAGRPLSLESTASELLDHPVAWEAVRAVIVRALPEFAHALTGINQQGLGNVPLRQMITMLPHADTVTRDIGTVLAEFGRK
jgi:alpha-L-rhamnosidase